MKKRISILCVMMAMLVMVPLLQACSDSGGSEGKVELTMSAWGNPAELKVYQRAIDAYEEKNKNVSVKLIPIPSDGYEQKLMTELSGGAGADVFYVGDTTMAKLVKSESILPLSDFLKTDASYTKPEEYAEGLWGAAKQGDELYGITVDCNPYVMYYNIKLFKEAGLKTPQEYFDEGKWNWDTFKEVTAKFKSINKYGFVQEKGSLPMLNWVWSNGGNMYDKDGNYVYDKDPKAQEAIAYIADLVKSGGVIYGGSLPKGQGMDAMFMSQQVAMVTAGRWLTPMFSENKSLEFDYIPWPSNTSEKTNPSGIAVAYVAVNKNSKQQEEAKKFLSFYVSKEGQKARLADTGNAVPSVAGIDEVVLDKGIPAHADYLLKGRDTGIAPGSPQTYYAQVPGLSNEVEDLYDLMLLGKASAEETIANISTVVQKKTAEAK